jgi:hypothetical protein
MQLRRGNENRNSRCNLAIRFLHCHLTCLFCDSAMNNICDHTTAWLTASSNTHNNEKDPRCQNSHNYVTNTTQPLSTPVHILSQKNPVHAISSRSIFILSSRLHLRIPSGLFLKNEFPQINVYWCFSKKWGTADSAWDKMKVSKRNCQLQIISVSYFICTLCKWIQDNPPTNVLSSQSRMPEKAIRRHIRFRKFS